MPNVPNPAKIEVVEDFVSWFQTQYQFDIPDLERGDYLVKHYLNRNCHAKEFNAACQLLVSDPALRVLDFDDARDRPFLSKNLKVKIGTFNGAMLRTHKAVGGMEDKERSNVLVWQETWGFAMVTESYSISKSVQLTSTRDGRMLPCILLVPNDIAKGFPGNTTNTPDIVRGYRLTVKARNVRSADSDELFSEALAYVKQITLPAGTMIYRVLDTINIGLGD